MLYDDLHPTSYCTDTPNSLTLANDRLALGRWLLKIGMLWRWLTKIPILSSSHPPPTLPRWAG